ncbi:MAG: NUDIX hydrolase [Aeromicrobium sp.]|uniref:NUDIX hydrolase n=1 Tax=Aeromicrobium sp. TaxID=1871063 RepID=UPI0039E3EE13
MARERMIVAAGGVVWRPRPGSRDGVEVLVAHRPRYDDWTFPKGKLDPGESVRQTAVREIAEETGYRVRLGLPLPTVRYRVGAGPKVVHYWTAQLDPDEPGGFAPNKEVDEIVWVRPRAAKALLTYAHDLDLLAAFRRLRDRGAHKSRVLVVTRHGKAAPRSKWRGADDDRPLSDLGLRQAVALAASITPYGPGRVLTSPALRCRQTVEPLAAKVRVDPRLAEPAPRGAVTAAVREAVARRRLTVLCTHLPTMTPVFDALSLPEPDLAPGEAVVVHHRHGRVLATERLP